MLRQAIPMLVIASDDAVMLTTFMLVAVASDDDAYDARRKGPHCIHLVCI